jgi:hypothetical protein
VVRARFAKLSLFKLRNAAFVRLLPPSTATTSITSPNSNSFAMDSRRTTRSSASRPPAEPPPQASSKGKGKKKSVPQSSQQSASPAPVSDLIPLTLSLGSPYRILIGALPPVSEARRSDRRTTLPKTTIPFFNSAGVRPNKTFPMTKTTLLAALKPAKKTLDPLSPSTIPYPQLSLRPGQARRPSPKSRTWT